jgi:hypothetical protein
MVQMLTELPDARGRAFLLYYYPQRRARPELAVLYGRVAKDLLSSQVLKPLQVLIGSIISTKRPSNTSHELGRIRMAPRKKVKYSHSKDSIESP